ncbi:S41 family peptidase [Arenibacter sp. GZD96]|uniref:S41 family peptidase n=1 Tax=Aurantibrevibacter litoralis TaxID=3106030 RepID=UPI002AFE7FC0|nr:S41 family peptidase [Arenibacter sp. GZD-96]MEA1786905.1 S41 family peptidase [Arenibacter sp. GZD-96]
MKKYVLLFLGLSFLFYNCSSDDDNDSVVEEAVNPPLPLQPTPVVLTNEINDFVWSAMNSWYFWQDEVLELGDNRFANQDAYFTFLNQFQTPRGLFQTLRSPKDRFSVIVDDFDILFNSFAGVFTSNGVEFVLTRPPSGGTAVIAVVRYIVPGSSAAATSIKRGDVIFAINGTPLFATTDNQGNILSSNLELFNPDVITLNFADIVGNELVPNGIDIEVTKTQITENPILISKVIEGTSIGYLMYNSFTSNFDDALNAAFGELKSQGVTDLVLDLRYNLGGSVLSAIRLSSLITGQFAGSVLSRDKWNDKWQPIFGAEDFFVNEMNGTPLNSLNLNSVYIIATDDSASASEYVINSLAPYINVTHIGSATVGKNEFSVTLVDNPGQVFQSNGQPDLPLPFIVLSENAGFTTVADANPNHKYAMQPLVGTNENADGFSDFTNGLQPDIEILESLGNLGQLGDPEEPLLARALQEINGTSAKSLSVFVPEHMKIKTIGSSNRLKPYRDILHKDTFKK